MDPVTQYAEDVLEGRIVAGQPVRWACERHFRDLERDDIYLDLEEIDRRFKLMGYLRHYEGEWRGRPFEPEPWQQFRIGSVFGWKRRTDDLRRFFVSWTEVARKQGKSLEAAAVGHSVMLQDGEGGCQIYNVATKKDQARIVFRGGMSMAKSSVDFRDEYQLLRDRIVFPDLEAFWTFLGRDSDTEDGLNPHLAIFDEVHAMQDGKMWDVIRSGMGSRRQPLIWAITTAGLQGGFGKEQHDHYLDVIDPNTSVEDDRAFVYIATLDEDDDPLEDEECWIKANPNLGVSVRVDYLRGEVQEAKNNPRRANGILCKNFDLWQEQSVRWLDMKHWDACAEQPNMELLRGERCYAGLDLSSVEDVTALVLFFPDSGAVLPFFWIPREGMEKRIAKERIPYDIWESQGFVTVTDGNVVDYSAIRGKLTGRWEIFDGEGGSGTERRDGALVDLFDVREVGFDRWGATKLAQTLQDHDGLKMVPMGQGYGAMSAPAKEVEKLVLGHELKHGGHPVLRRQAATVSVKMDPAGNIKLDKEKSAERIDGMVALTMAVGRAAVAPEEYAYADHDPMVGQAAQS